jgi:beta-N-acetylhexosaminidase
MKWNRLIVLLWVLSISTLVAIPQIRVDAVLNSLTLEQKVGQMFMVTFYGYPPNEQARDLLNTWQPGAVALLPENLGTPLDITSLTNTIQQIVIDNGSVPMFIAVDQEGGMISHLEEGFTEFPAPSLWTATQDNALVYELGQAMAQEMLAVGINMNLAPVADLDTNPNNPIIGRRSWGSYPDLVAPMLTAWIQGAQDMGMLATAKHFPGHGDTSTDSHVTLPVITADIDRLRGVELVPFTSAIQVQVGAIMMAHIDFTELDDVENLPASLSPAIINGLLREEMGYSGIVMTDAMDMDAIDTVYSPIGRALRAIEAGNDWILLGANISPNAQAEAMQAVVDAVRAGTISEQRIDASVRRILIAKERFGVFDWQPLDPNTVDTRLNRMEHEALVSRLFVSGITLVKDDFGALPMPENTLFIYPATRPSLWQACQREDIQPLGVSGSPSDEEIAWATTAAQNASHVVVFTWNASTDPSQVALVNALPVEKTLVIALQDVRDIESFSQVGAYMVTYSPMLSANLAICDILLGNVSVKGTISTSLQR